MDSVRQRVTKNCSTSKELNKALVQTVESFRFKVHPFIIPIINKSLLDKTIRSHLIQFQVVVRDRGAATVCRIRPSQFTEKVYYEYFCDELFNKDFCDKPSCLGCKQLETCNVFRAQYERRKVQIQDERYEQARDLAKELETRRLTLEQIKLSLTVRDKWLTEKGVDVQRLRATLMDEYGLRIGNNKGYQLTVMVEMHHPELLKQNEE